MLHVLYKNDAYKPFMHLPCISNSHIKTFHLESFDFVLHNESQKMSCRMTLWLFPKLFFGACEVCHIPHKIKSANEDKRQGKKKAVADSCN